MRPTYQVTELSGDGIGPELSRAVHTLAEALPVHLEFLEVDLTLANRRARGQKIYDEAVESITATRVALKHPTATAEESPNAILRRRLDLAVIHRPVYTIPGVPTNFRRELDLDIVRIATGGTYDDPGRMIGEDGAVSLRIVERRAVREAARYAFNLARRTGKRVTSSSKYTIQKATDGLFEQVAREVAGQFPEVPHGIELFDALLGKVIMAPEKFQIVLVLNEYGDFLSDMACGLAGSLGIGASANLGFDPAAVVRVALFDAAHGTAPDIAGKNLANPTAIFLALSMLLYQLGEISVGKAVKDTTLDLLRGGVRTGDLGGKETTETFTAAVAEEVARRLRPQEVAPEGAPGVPRNDLPRRSDCDRKTAGSVHPASGRGSLYRIPDLARTRRGHADGACVARIHRACDCPFLLLSGTCRRTARLPLGGTVPSRARRFVAGSGSLQG